MIHWHSEMSSATLQSCGLHAMQSSGQGNQLQSLEAQDKPDSEVTGYEHNCSLVENSNRKDAAVTL